MDKSLLPHVQRKDVQMVGVLVGIEQMRQNRRIHSKFQFLAPGVWPIVNAHTLV